MTPKEYAALKRAWRKRERRTAELFVAVCLTVSRSLGGKLEASDLLDPEESEE